MSKEVTALEYFLDPQEKILMSKECGIRTIEMEKAEKILDEKSDLIELLKEEMEVSKWIDNEGKKKGFSREKLLKGALFFLALAGSASDSPHKLYEASFKKMRIMTDELVSRVKNKD